MFWMFGGWIFLLQTEFILPPHRPICCGFIDLRCLLVLLFVYSRRPCQNNIQQAGGTPKDCFWD
uniref:Uncharacterized protein n=1 Tax=Anguilla anguilla TaxID=7936 RepID=A0A0E9WLF1_ANGAN